jgi:sn-glycerol 3-phosphate transport system substrate-binding protein
VTGRGVLLLVAAALVASCSSGDSILDSGNEAPTTTVSVTTTPPTDQPGPSGPTVAPSGSTSSPTTAAPTTTTSPLDSLRPCPVDALSSADGPVDVVFWHGFTGQTEVALVALTDAYNASQSRVRVRLEGQGSYESSIDKYVQSSQSSRPDLVVFPEYVMQQTIDSDSVVPIATCIRAAEFDTSAFLPKALATYSTEGVQWAMPFAVSNPVLYYNRSVFRAAGLDPDVPPQSLDDLRQYSQTIVDSGAASYGIAIDSGFSSGGGWFVEQWLANAGELYADNGNGRTAPATKVLYDNPTVVDLLTFVQSMVQDGLAAYVGGNAGGQDTYLKVADRTDPAAATIGSSASLGTIIDAVDKGLIPGITGADIGVGPLPGPSGTPTALVGGASLYIVADHGDDVTAAVWDYVAYLVAAQSQSDWAKATGYVPVRVDALDLDPIAAAYRDDPRYRVAYDQLVGSPDDPALLGPLLGPQREVRIVTARAVAEILDGGDVQAALTDAATQADALIADYNARN